MKAIGIQHFGGSEAMQLLNLPRPKPKGHEVLVKIHAAGVNPVDWKIREGLLEGRLPHQFPIVLGWDASGVIEEVGEKVDFAKVGDEVFAYARRELIHEGTYSEYINLEQRHVAPKPKNISFEEAAVIPLAGLTAYQALFEGIKLQPNEKILIHAGAGGVGSFAIQMAKHRGAYVLTTASETHHPYLKNLGADEIIDYKKVKFVQEIQRKFPKGIDAVFDTVGAETQLESADVLKKGGRLISILALQHNVLKEKGVEANYLFVRPDHEQLVKIGKMVEAGQLKPYITKTFPLDQAVQALDLIQTGHTEGKIVLKVVNS